ncbi:MAG TPA: STAS domain-containing protein [Acidimicrobiales bacterium]|jgi:anti-sigma B factor antagonist|nr:STAS domain-containing protein [Acidimicrobiales bacterium]
MAAFEVEAVASGPHAVVVVRGEIDAHTSPLLKERLLALVAEGIDRLVVDLRAVTFIESVGLGTLVAARKRLRQSDKSLCLVLGPEQGVLRRTFEITGLDKVFPIHPDVEAAVEDCLREPAA